MVRRSLALTAACVAAAAGSAFARPTPNVITNISASTISADGNTVYYADGRPVKVTLGSSGGLGTLTRATLGATSDNGGQLFASADGSVLAYDGYVIGPNGAGIFEGSTCVQISTNNGVTWTPMPLLADQTDCGSVSSVWDISPNGRYVVGGTYVGLSPCAGQSGFIFDRDTNTVTRLSDIAAWGASATGLPEAASFNPGTPRPQFWANSVSDDGSVVVGYGNPTTPVVWDRDGMGVYHPTRLSSSVAVGGSQRSYVSRDGSAIVGGSFDTPTFGTKWTKVGGVWTPSAIPTNMTSVASNFGRPTSWVTFDVTSQRVSPTAISQDGSVIAGVISYSDGMFSEASGTFIWTAATGTIDLWDYLITTSPDTGIQAFQGGDLTGVSAVIKDNTPAQNIVIAAYGGFLAPPALIKFDAAPLCYPPTFFRTLANQEISSCNTSIFIAPGEAAGTGPFSYEWFKNGSSVVLGPTMWGSNISMFFGSALMISTAQTPDAGQYYCRAYGSLSGPCLGGHSGDSNTMTLTSISNPVPNDTCSTATLIGGLPYTAPTWDVCHAPLNNIIGASCVLDSVGDVWFKYTPAINQTVRVSMCGNNFDSVLSVYTAGPGPTDVNCTDTEIACVDADTSFNCSTYNFAVATIARLDLTGGQTYLFRAAGKYLSAFDPYNPGVFTIETAPSVPANDSCATAAIISPATLPVNALVNNLDATTDGVQPTCGPESGRDVWFSFTPSVTQDYRLSTCGGSASDPTDSAPFDTVLSIHSNCTSFAEVACSNNQGSPQASQCDGASTSRIDRITLTSGTPYFIRVASAAPFPGNAYGGAADANLNVSVAPPLPANDQCASAQAVSTAGAAPYSISGIQNAEATTDMGSSATCADSFADLWYTFTPPSTPANGWRIQLCGHGFPWNSVISVHTGCVGSTDNEVACNNFAGGNAPSDPAPCDGQGSRIDQVTLTQGVTYYIRVASSYGRGSPSNTATLTIGAAPATPVNDQCAGALPASVGSTPFNLTEATPQGSAVEIGCDSDPNSFTPYSAQDVWFTFTPPCNGNYNFMVCGSYSDPTDIDPILHVYANCAAYPTLPPLACNNDISAPFPVDACSFDVNQRTARISDLPLTAGVPVRVRVAVAAFNPSSSNRPGNPTGNLQISTSAACSNCCRGTTCNPVGPGGCTGQVAGSNSVIVGACSGTSHASCCFADFNHDGIQSIDDLFLYFNAYFTSSPYANFGGDGVATPTIDDLFLYINAYFSTCS